MATTPPITVETPAPVTHITATVKRSWKTRIVTIANTVLTFVLALLAYLQSINLANFGITAERALFYMTCFGLLQFVLMQMQPYFIAHVKADPGGEAGEGG